MTPLPSTHPDIHLPAGARILASGLGFTEGPALLRPGSVAVVSINRGHVYEVPLDGRECSLIADVGGGPNGLAVGTSGEIWVTQNGGTLMRTRSTLPATPSVQRIVGGKVETVANGLSAPSDCVVGPDGNLWFTDPAHHGVGGAVEPGSLRTLDPVTRQVETRKGGLLFPNGLAFGVDATQLYVAETGRGVVRRYNITGDKCEPDGWEVAMPGERPDGMAVDSEGWLWVAGSVGDNVVAFDADGSIRESLHFGDGVLVTSVCFAGVDLDTLVVTIAKGGTVAAVPARHAGLPLPVRRVAT